MRAGKRYRSFDRCRVDNGDNGASSGGCNFSDTEFAEMVLGVACRGHLEASVTAISPCCRSFL